MSNQYVAREFLHTELKDSEEYQRHVTMKLVYRIAEKIYEDGYIKASRLGDELIVHHGYAKQYWELVMCSSCERVVNVDKAVAVTPPPHMWICESCQV